MLTCNITNHIITSIPLHVHYRMISNYQTSYMPSCLRFQRSNAGSCCNKPKDCSTLLLPIWTAFLLPACVYDCPLIRRFLQLGRSLRPPHSTWRSFPHSFYAYRFWPAPLATSDWSFHFISIPPPSAEISSLHIKGRNFPLRSPILHQNYTSVHMPAHCPMLRWLLKELSYATTFIRGS